MPSTVAADAKDVEGVLTDLEEIARSVHVVVEADGSVLVEGIPPSVPPAAVIARVTGAAFLRCLMVLPTASPSCRFGAAVSCRLAITIAGQHHVDPATGDTVWVVEGLSSFGGREPTPIVDRLGMEYRARAVTTDSGDTDWVLEVRRADEPDPRPDTPPAKP